MLIKVQMIFLKKAVSNKVAFLTTSSVTHSLVNVTHTKKKLAL